ncbi:MAG TPA: cupin domain-containing protein [Terriglobales bacterium]|nr:cupin domain-containing protein [Terriglobales bacterium]
MRVERWDSAKDGPLSESALRKKLEHLGFSVTRYVYPPGTEFPPHTHDRDKMDAVVSGQFQISMGKERVVLGPGDALHVPVGVAHSAEVVGGSAVVSLDGVKSRFPLGI